MTLQIPTEVLGASVTSLKAVLCDSTQILWHGFSTSFLGGLGSHTGPEGYPDFAWVTHCLQRDRLFQDAVRQGHKGWLNPPVVFFSELPKRFEFFLRPVSLLEREGILDRLSASFDQGGVPPGLGPASDRLLAELLPEGITADLLQAALDTLPADDFARARNRLLVSLLRDYQAELAQLGRYDFRSVHAQIAAAIRKGKLPQAIGGARRLHIYGLTSTHRHGALLRALADQKDVEVVLYLLDDDATREEWDALLGTEQASDQRPATNVSPRVQPAPDEHRELEYVASEVKRLVLEEGVAPDRIAVVARIGRTDARLAHEALERAGVPVTARLRWRLDEIPALKAVMLLLRGAALGWGYRALRHLLESSYFDLPANLRDIDKVAKDRRITGLAAWHQARPGIESLKTLRDQAAELDPPRSLTEWIATTRRLLDPGWFEFRKRICRVPSDRYDLVRLDQQGVTALEALLADWATVEHSSTPISAADWHARLRRFLGTNELALTTPLQTGVQVLEAHEAALVPFDHLFLIHANDGEFPRAWSAGGLFTEPEREALAAAGLPVAHRALALRRERALWRAVTSGPATTITYRTADAAGVPLLPSLLVPPHDSAEEIPRTRFIYDRPFTPAHADRTAMAAFAGSRRGQGGPITVPRPEMIARALVAGFAESRRLASADGLRPAGMLGPWNGLLRDPVVLTALGSRFGPEYVWSASQLETYSQNPFMFFLQKVLGIEEVEEAEEDTTALTVGSIGHEVLERFHSAFTGRLPAELTADAAAELERLALEVFATAEQKDEWLGVPAVWGVRKRQILKHVREYLAWELERMGRWVPIHYEFAFGFEGDPPVTLEYPDLSGAPVRLRLRGKIDRVDHCRGAHRVIDYKSGSVPGQKGYGDGATLQGPLYMAVLRARDLMPGEAEYRSIRNRRVGGKVKWSDPEAGRALAIAHSIPARVRAGRFEPSAANSCGWQNYWPGGMALFRVECCLDADGFRFDE